MPETIPTDRPRTHALVTMVIGRIPYAERTLALMQRWAEREGWDFHVIDEWKIRYNPNWPRRRYGAQLEKFQLWDYLGRYDRVLYLDADIVVHPAAPNPFSLVPPQSLGGVWDDTDDSAWKREEELANLARRHGALPHPERTGPRFLNTGMLVMGKAHRDLWTFDKKAFIRGRWPEQSLLNYRLLRSETRIAPLPEEFNFMPLHADRFVQDERRRASYLVHYAGQPAKPLLEADLPIFEAAWKVI